MACIQLSQVTVAENEKRRELVISGPKTSKVIEEYGLDTRLYSLSLLNFLEISDSCLSSLSDDIGNLTSLVSLVLRGNKLSSLPQSINKLHKLHLFDVSRNQLTGVPDNITDLSELQTLDISYNLVSELPSNFCNLTSLSVLKVSNNKLENIDLVCSSELVHLAEINASHNEITSLGHEICDLSVLKKLDLSENKICEFPTSLASCAKLKELNLKGNPIKDKKLLKLVQQERGIKPIIENISTRGLKPESNDNNTSTKSTNDKKNKNRRKKKNTKDQQDTEDEICQSFIEVLHFQEAKDSVEVIVTRDAVDVRPYIVCCVVQDLDLKRGKLFKNFIKLQTRLHDGPLCAKRTKATIATHDMYAIQSPLLYDARYPQDIQIIPLGKTKPVTAQKLVTDLRKEAEEMRKEQKRNTFSGIHKYLDLLADHDKFPCLTNKDGHVLSFPPITNADLSKISPETDCMLIEVTSSKDLASCKRVMEELIREMLEMDLTQKGLPPPPDGKSPPPEGNKDFYEDSDKEDESGDRKGQSDTQEGQANTQEVPKKLILKQVKIVDEGGTLKVVYPSRTDLDFPGIKVIRT